MPRMKTLKGSSASQSFFYPIHIPESIKIFSPSVSSMLPSHGVAARYDPLAVLEFYEYRIHAPAREYAAALPLAVGQSGTPEPDVIERVHRAHPLP